MIGGKITGTNIINPDWSDWHYELASLHVSVLTGDVPNKFHRVMQKLILGINWVKEE